jgi:ribosomal protein S18 acetylase RimI-like enzyme
MSSTIRPATADDVRALVELMTEFYAEAGLPLSSARATRAFQALLADPQLGAIWLAEEAAAAVGYVVLTLGFCMDAGGLRGFIDDLYVRPRSRRRGVGAALLAAVRSACAKRGVRALHVEVGPENLTARGLYERSGYMNSGHQLLSLQLASPMHAS